MTVLGVKRPQAKSIEPLDNVVKRLTDHLEKVATRKAMSKEDLKKKSKDIERLKAVIEQNHLKHREILDSIRIKAPVEAQAAIEMAIQRLELNYREALESIGKISP
jgi:predicted XRE-type DNA-binding protein